MLTEFEKIYIQYSINIMTDLDLIKWAEEVLGSNNPLSKEPLLLELASLPRSNKILGELPEILIKSIVDKNKPDFHFSNPDVELYAKASFQKLCYKLIEGIITPNAFCRVIVPIENIFDFPDWLGEFYNYCDWCETESMNDDFRDLIDYTKNYVKQISA